MFGRRRNSSTVALLLVLTVPATTSCNNRGRSVDSCHSRPLATAEASAVALEPIERFAVPGTVRVATLVSTTLRRSNEGVLPAQGVSEPLAHLLQDPAMRGISIASTENPTVQILAGPNVTDARWCQIAGRVREAAPDAVLILQPASGPASALVPSPSS